MGIEALSWARCRPVEHRTLPPRVGDRVWYRCEHETTPVPATVVGLPDPEPDDWNVVRVVTNPATASALYGPDGKYLKQPVSDPWPDVLLKVYGQPGHVVTREARLGGSAGWLPLDWRERDYPHSAREVL